MSYATGRGAESLAAMPWALSGEHALSRVSPTNLD